MKTVYASVKTPDSTTVRVGAVYDVENGMVHLHIVNGERLGGFNIERFTGGKVTEKTIKNLFENP